MLSDEDRTYTKTELHFVLNETGQEVRAMLEEAMRESQRTVSRADTISAKCVLGSIVLAASVISCAWILGINNGQLRYTALAAICPVLICYFAGNFLSAWARDKAHAQAAQQAALILFGNPQFMKEFLSVQDSLHYTLVIPKAYARARKMLKEQAREPE